MNDDIIYASLDGIEVIDFSEYSEELTKHFVLMPEVAKPLLKEAKEASEKIKRMLYAAPSLIDLIKANIPNVTLQTVLTGEQKQQIAKGALKLMTKKDGSLMANLVNPETNKIVAPIPLKVINVGPEIAQAMANYAAQMQLAQIAEQIQVVQIAIEEVHQGQEYDRLATAYSCQQKLLQAMEIKNPNLRAMALMQIASDAEDSRNLLMLSQRANVDFISKQPEAFWKKVFSGVDKDKIDSRIYEVRENLYAVNMVSLTQAIAYQELGENTAVKKSLIYYADFVRDTYLSTPSLLKRLDSMDPSPENFWSKTLPNIEKKIKALSCEEDMLLTGELKNEKCE